MSTFEKMVGTLHKSVTDIVAAAPENRDELLATSFAEFEAAVAPELHKAVVEETGEALAKFVTENGGQAQEPLFKGLGSVGRIANLVSTVARMAKDIQDGTGYDNEGDAASDEVASLLDHMVAVGELALRAAVNDHVEVADPDEAVDDDLSYVSVPNAEAPDDDSASMVLKTVLPMELAKFACDPAGIALAIMELGSGLLLDVGVPQETLSKLFEVDSADVLAKDAGGVPQPQDGGDQAQAGADPNDLGAQLEIMGRIVAAALMQVDHVMQIVEGGSSAGSMDGQDPGMDDGSADAGADGADAGTDADGADADAEGDDAAAAPDASAPPAGGDDSKPADGDAPEKKKNPFAKSGDLLANDLRKQMDDMKAEMAKMASAPNPQIAELQAQITRLSAQPQAPKGVVQATGLSKVADVRGSEDPVQKLADEFDACRTDEQRNQLMLKAAFKYPGVDFSVLQKGR